MVLAEQHTTFKGSESSLSGKQAWIAAKIEEIDNKITARVRTAFKRLVRGICYAQLPGAHIHLTKHKYRSIPPCIYFACCAIGGCQHARWVPARATLLTRWMSRFAFCRVSRSTPTSSRLRHKPTMKFLRKLQTYVRCILAIRCSK